MPNSPKAATSPHKTRPSVRLDLWSMGALVIAALVLAPILSVLVMAFWPTENIWPHLMATSLPRYMANTLILMTGVGLLSASVGAGAAWLTTLYRFPGAGLAHVLLLAPLAMPAYVGAYALVDFLQYSGPVQTALRDTFGWSSARDYWFPTVRARGFAILVLSAALYPYAYLLTRSALREQPASAYEVARALGSGPWGLFWRVGLPLARPAIAAGAALAMMETVNDYGVVTYFGIQTLTSGIFSVWLSAGNAGGAAQLAVVLLAVILVLVMVERASRKRQRYYQPARNSRPVLPTQLHGGRAILVLLICLVPPFIGFVLPVMVMLGHALAAPTSWLDAGLMRALVHTATTAGGAAILTVTAALVMVYGVRLTAGRVPQMLLPLTTLGYAAPGAVLAVGLLIPLAHFDNWLADGVLGLTGWDPGLMLTGTAATIVLAYMVRFFGIAQGAVDSAFGRISPSLPMAARSLGRDRAATLSQIYLPLMRGSVGTALLLVFVDATKELPATLLLRPFNYDTLATRVHEKASLENLTQAAPAALLVMLVGMCAVVLLARAHPMAPPRGQ